jgi:uridine kinase
MLIQQFNWTEEFTATKNQGYTRGEIIYQWDNHVIPCYNEYLAPHETKAEFIYHNDSRAENDFIRLIKVLEPVLPKEKIV